MKLVFVALLAAGSAAAPAAAQVASGLSGSSSSRPVQMEELWVELGAYGRCVAGARPQQAIEMLRADMGTPEERERLDRLIRDRDTGCSIDFDLILPGPLFRGAIAEGLYQRGVAMPADLAWDAIPKGSPVPTFSHIARCYLPGNEEKVKALVETTRPGSRGEARAMAAIMPGFRACIPGALRNRSFNLTQVRLRLAEALLRMAAPRADAGQR